MRSICVARLVDGPWDVLESSPVMTADGGLQKIIWIASYPKSGNTWVRIFIHNLLREIRGNAADVQDINRLSQYTTRECKAGPYQQLLGRSPQEWSPLDIARARPEVQLLLAASHTRPFLVKTHLIMAQLAGFSTINLDATLAGIYIIRNPLDVAISFAHHTGRSIEDIIAQMANPMQWCNPMENQVYEPMGSWSAHVASWMAVFDRPVFVMRYEDMLRSPLEVFGRLAGFLRLAPTGDQLQRAIDKSSFSEVSRQEQEKGFWEKPAIAEKFFRAGAADQWRDVLSKEQVQRIASAHAPMMQRAGYLLPDCGGDVLPLPDQRHLEDSPIGQSATRAGEVTSSIAAFAPGG